MRLTLKRLLGITFTVIFVIWAAATALSLGMLKASNDRYLYAVEVSMGQMADVERLFGDHFGSLDGFGWATTAEEAEGAGLEPLLERRLDAHLRTLRAMLGGADGLYSRIIPALTKQFQGREDMIGLPTIRIAPEAFQDKHETMDTLAK